MGNEFVRPNNFVKGLQEHETYVSPDVVHSVRKLFIILEVTCRNFGKMCTYNNVIKFLKKTALVTISVLAHPSRISIGGFFIIAYLFVKDNRGPWAQICFAANRLCCTTAAAREDQILC